MGKNLKMTQKEIKNNNIRKSLTPIILYSKSNSVLKKNQINDSILSATSINLDNNTQKMNENIEPEEYKIETKNEKENKVENKIEADSGPTIKTVFLDWVSNSTAHATPRIFKDTHIITRIYWFIVMLASWAGCFYFLITTLLLFLEYGYNTNYEYVEERPTVFPAIDICNLNPYDANTNISNYISVSKFENLDIATIEAINNDPGVSDDENPLEGDIFCFIIIVTYLNRNLK